MESFIKESKRLIKKAINNNKLVIFVGAGISRNSGYPSWEELVKNIAQKIGYDSEKLTNDDYLKIPQYYYNSRKEKEYNELIEEFFDIKNPEPNLLHSAILNLNTYHIVTTNYDDLIETYIKALISSHVILFVGYSINDINVKYIFQWVKEILGNDFQQAYFISIDKEGKGLIKMNLTIIKIGA